MEVSIFVYLFYFHLFFVIYIFHMIYIYIYYYYIIIIKVIIYPGAFYFDRAGTGTFNHPALKPCNPIDVFLSQISTFGSGEKVVKPPS